MENKRWWEDGAGFFGKYYVAGDNSFDGFLPSRKLTLEERTQREVSGILKLLDLQPGASLLDVPCGYGRHSMALAEKGFAVTGADINNYHLGLAHEEMQRRSNKPTFIRADMRELRQHLKDQFEAVVNMFFSFGFFDDEAENERIMAQFYDCLHNDGKLLVHTDVTVEMITEGDHYRMEETRQLRDGSTLTIRESFDKASRRLNGSWSIRNGNGEKFLTPYSVRIYTAQEYINMARQAGFRKIDVFGSFDDKVEYTRESEEMIVVATK
jgi:SAM-dependent methyltransferase